MVITAPVRGGLCMSAPPRTSLRASSSSRSIVACQPLRTSFTGRVNALKVVHNPSLRLNKNACNALGSQMNFLNGLAKVAKSAFGKIYKRDVLTSADGSPEATLEVLESEEELENKYKLAKQAADEWYRKGIIAFEDADDDLGHEAVKQFNLHRNYVSSIRAKLDALPASKKKKPKSCREEFAEFHNHPKLSPGAQLLVDETLKSLYAVERSMKFMRWLIDL